MQKADKVILMLKKLNSYKFTYSLILINTILLGIWATQNTIALRNILLWGGALSSVIYLAIQSKEIYFKKLLTFRKTFPILLLGLLFIWILCHYLFFNIYKQEQFQELSSTWLRSLLAAIIAFAMAVAVGQKKIFINLIWTGLFISILIYLIQFLLITKTQNNYTTFIPITNTYIFHAKINVVLVGTILVAGLTGCLFISNKLASKYYKYYLLLIWATSYVLIIYLYVFALNSRTGFALSIFILVFALIWYFIAKNRVSMLKLDFTKMFCKEMLIFTIVFIFIIWFVKEHINKSVIWENLLEDVYIGVQIEKYQNWRDPTYFGYPKTSSGRGVFATTYERTAWPTAGVLIFVPEHPLGIGVLSRAFPRILEMKYGNYIEEIPSTHSAWVDLTLSYGLPCIFLLVFPLLSLIYISIRRRSSIDGFIFILSASILLLYTLGELSVKHGVEMLIYFIAFLSGLNMVANLDKEISYGK